MEEFSHVLCLFCQTGKETGAIKHIERAGWGTAISPRKTRRVRDKNSWTEDSAPLLPGYVFVYLTSEQAAYQFEMARLPQVIRVLGYGEGAGRFLTGADLEFARWVWQQGGRIGKIDVLETGDRVEITDSAFASLHGTIRKMDRRRQTLLVELDEGNAIKSVWLPYHLVEKS